MALGQADHGGAEILLCRFLKFFLISKCVWVSKLKVRFIILVKICLVFTHICKVISSAFFLKLLFFMEMLVIATDIVPFEYKSFLMCNACRINAGSEFPKDLICLFVCDQPSYGLAVEVKGKNSYE